MDHRHCGCFNMRLSVDRCLPAGRLGQTFAAGLSPTTMGLSMRSPFLRCCCCSCCLASSSVVAEGAALLFEAAPVLWLKDSHSRMPTCELGLWLTAAELRHTYARGLGSAQQPDTTLNANHPHIGLQ